MAGNDAGAIARGAEPRHPLTALTPGAGSIARRQYERSRPVKREITRLMASHAAPARRAVIRRRPNGSNIRWDRLGRLALLAMLVAIVLLYVSPVKHWMQQSRTQSHQQEELDGLQQENARLEAPAQEPARAGRH